MPTGIPWRFTRPTADSLELRERELWRFGERMGHVLSVHQELAKVTRGKRFNVYHEPMLHMFIGEANMIVVELASWAFGFYKEKGFLRSLRGSDFDALRLKWDEGQSGPENRTSRKASFDRLFPHGVTPSRKGRGGPTQADIEKLSDRLHAEFRALRDDRNQYRAHKYENDRPKTAAELSPVDVTKYLDACQQLLADIRVLASNSGLGAYRYKAEAHEDDRWAQDIVDHILFGSLRSIIDADPNKSHREKDEFYWQRRTAHYERLHVAHAACGDAEWPFNDRVRFRFEDGVPGGTSEKQPPDGR